MRRLSESATRGLLPTLVVVAAVLVAACDSTVPDTPPRGGLDSEYLSVGSGDTCRVLALRDDGKFVVYERARDTWSDRTMRPTPEPVAEGSWVMTDGRLQLDGNGWTVAFVPDSTRVEVPRRSTTLSSLRWVTSTDASPFSACDLVSASEFDEFLHPTEGSGSSGW